jgi:hypothetical protein
MIGVNATKKGSFNGAAKQIRFAAAVGLTRTAKDGQAAVSAKLADNFTLRTRWYEPSNAMGIRVKAAKKTDLAAEIKTKADWLEKFETGEEKLPRRRFLAIPTSNVRRNKRDIITRANRPAQLRDKRTFLLETRRGLTLFQRKYRGKRSFIVPLYLMRQHARTPKRPSFYAPARHAALTRFGKNFADALREAFATARK